jgi:dCMP deaminase
MRNFDYQYLRIAKIWSENSYSRRNKVGAIIVKDGMIISDGYNGTPSGFDNNCENEVKCDIDPSDSLDGGASICMTYNDDCNKCPHHYLVTKPEVLHAEANAITKVAKTTNSSDGSTLYVTLSPCIECAKLIIQAGIKRVVYNDVYRNTDGLELLKKAGIELVQIKDLD